MRIGYIPIRSWQLTPDSSIVTISLTRVVFVRIVVWWQLFRLATRFATLLMVKLPFRPVV